MPDWLCMSDLASMAEMHLARDALVDYPSSHSAAMTVVFPFEAGQVHRVIK
ncbi:MAG: hypothetical protein ACK4FW_02065 [Stenotrophomonas sp.]